MKSVITTMGLIAFQIALGSPGTAQVVSPSFDCAKASGAVEEVICNDPMLAALDNQMAERFAHAVAAAQQMGAGADAATSDLRAYQRGWIKGRNDCWKASDIQDCITMSYRVREGELVSLWMLEEPQAVVRYTCNGTPANEVYAMYFATELHSLRLEYGDRILTGQQTRSASGAKYALSFGGYFWDSGGTASFAPPEGAEMHCEKGG